MHRRSKLSLPRKSDQVGDLRQAIAKSLHDGLAPQIDEIAADLAEIIGRRGLTPSTRTQLRQIAARQNALSASLRTEILALKNAPEKVIRQVIRVREFELLTKKELEILELLAQALTAKEIGEKLFISITTVKSHIAAIYRKLDVKNRTAAITRATEAGILTF